MKIHDAFTRKRNEPFFISISLLITAALACALGSTVLKNSTTPSQQAATSLPLPTRTENLVQVTVTSTASSVIGINALRSSFDLAIDPSSPNIIYVATDGSGVYKSLDGGNIWRPVNTGISDLNVRSLAIDPASPSTIYTGAINDVFKSTDGGAHWQAMDQGLKPRTLILVLAIDPVTPTNIYAGTGFDGIYKSTDGGESWHAANTGLFASIYDLAIDPVAPSKVYAIFHNGVARSVDGGSHWQITTPILPNETEFHALAIDPETPTTLYMATDYFGIFKSTDGGRSWSSSHVGQVDAIAGALLVDPTNPHIVYTGTEKGVFKSTDSAATWSLINPGQSHSYIYDLAFDPATSTIFTAGFDGVCAIQQVK
jgi:photosystem II stability/assembly factor-like uncharacterized protein